MTKPPPVISSPPHLTFTNLSTRPTQWSWSLQEQQMINVLVHNLGTVPPSLSRPQGYSQQQSSARGGGWHDWPHALSISLYEVLPKGKNYMCCHWSAKQERFGH
jgi:hypothetical protein